MIIPTISGNPNNNSSAIPEPIISATSVAIMASSVIINKIIPPTFEVLSRVNCAKSRPVTIPKRAAMA